MKSIKKVLLYGFLVWLIPFMIAMLIFPLRTSDRTLFDSIMPVVLTLTVVIFSILYFREVDKGFLKEGILVAIIWLLINIVIDLLIFIRGPLKMPFVDYIKDIGITYLIIPIITIGVGYLIGRKR